MYEPETEDEREDREELRDARERYLDEHAEPTADEVYESDL